MQVVAGRLVYSSVQSECAKNHFERRNELSQEASASAGTFDFLQCPKWFKLSFGSYQIF